MEVTNNGRKIEYALPFLTTISAICLMLFSQFVIAAIFVGFDIDYDVYNGTFSFAYSLICIPLLLFQIRIAKKLYADNKSGVLRDKMTRAQYLPIVVIALGVIGMVTIYMVVVAYLSELAEVVEAEMEKYSETVDRFSTISKSSIPTIDNILYYISTFIMVPIMEELVFRGIILGEMLKKYKPWIAILYSALVFGLMHGISVQIGYALLAGVIFGFVYWATRSIYSTIAMHAIFNFFGGTLTYILEDFRVSEEIINTVFMHVNSFCILMMAPMVIMFIILYLERKRIDFGDDKLLGGTIKFVKGDGFANSHGDSSSSDDGYDHDYGGDDSGDEVDS